MENPTQPLWQEPLEALKNLPGVMKLLWKAGQNQAVGRQTEVHPQQAA